MAAPAHQLEKPKRPRVRREPIVYTVESRPGPADEEVARKVLVWIADRMR